MRPRVIEVVFVCLGNICRSPMAEFILKHMAEERGVGQSLHVISRGTSDEEEGNGIYPPAARVLLSHGISASHRSVQLTKKDVINADYVLVMDSGNLFDVLRITGGAFGEKIFKLNHFSGLERDVADPWWTRDFERAYSDISAGCKGFLDHLFAKHFDMLDYDRRH